MSDVALVKDGIVTAVWRDENPENVDNAAPGELVAFDTSVGIGVGWRFAGNRVSPPAGNDDVNTERDRRISAGFEFGGNTFDTNAESRSNIAGAMTMALAATAAGKQAGDLRWADPERDFAWISAENVLVPMDAPTCLAFALAAAAHKAGLIFKARALKDAGPIPADYTDDRHWT
jgi:hypothetical protein